MLRLDKQNRPIWGLLKDPRDRFKALSEWLWVESQRSLPDLELYELIDSQREVYRAACVKLLPYKESRLWDAGHNICVVAHARNAHARYRRREIQRKIAGYILDRRAKGESIKLCIPKARREGVTTESAVSLYLEVARGIGETGLVIAQSDKDATKIFRRTFKFLFDHDPLRPITSKANEEELVFPEINGAINIRSAAGRKAAERGSESTFFLGTETAHWEGDPYTLMTSIVAAMPKTRPTVAILETTGNGQAGYAFEKSVEGWARRQAIERGDAIIPDAEWDVMLLGWFMREEARLGLEFSDEKERERFESGMRDDEKLIQQEEQLSLEQMKWYRKLYNEIDVEGGGEENRLILLHQEHPTTFLDCWQAPGSSAFRIARLNDLKLKCKEPRSRYDVQVPGVPKEGIPLSGVKETPMPRLVPNKLSGALRVWKHPVEGHRYIWFWDLARSPKASADFTEAYCIDRDTEETVAHFQDKCEPNLAKAPCRMLSKLYNDAIINVETEAMGGSFIHSMTETDRLEFLYWSMVAGNDAAVAGIAQRVYGQQPGKHVKQQWVYIMREELENHPGYFVDRHVIDQMMNFKQVRTLAGDWLFPGATPGSGLHDDGVIALMGALKTHRDMPLTGPSPLLKGLAEKPRTVRDDMKGHREYEEKQMQELDAGGGWS